MDVKRSLRPQCFRVLRVLLPAFWRSGIDGGEFLCARPRTTTAEAENNAPGEFNSP